jgi:hypothetical protein
MSAALSKKGTNWGVFVSGGLTLANYIYPLPVPVELRPVLGAMAWSAFLFFCVCWALERIKWKWIARLRAHLSVRRPTMLILVFFLCGGLGVSLYLLIEKHSKAGEQPSSEQPDSTTTTHSASGIGTHANTFTPQEIRAQLEQTGPLEIEDVSAGFVNGVVDWTLRFSALYKLGKNEIQVQFVAETGPPPTVNCRIPLKGNEYLGRIKSPVPFRVKGVISHAELNIINLRDASIEQLPQSSPKPSPPREEGPRVVPPRSPLPQISPQSKVTSDLGPMELFALIEGRTPLQAAKIIEPYKGKWTEARGELRSPVFPYGEGCIATLHIEPNVTERIGKMVECRFHNKRSCEELDRLKIKDSANIRGKIEFQNEHTLVLSECELVH